MNILHLENCKMGQKARTFYRLKNKEQGKDKYKVSDWLGPKSALLVVRRSRIGLALGIGWLNNCISGPAERLQGQNSSVSFCWCGSLERVAPSWAQKLISTVPTFAYSYILLTMEEVWSKMSVLAWHLCLFRSHKRWCRVPILGAGYIFLFSFVSPGRKIPSVVGQWLPTCI